MMFRQGLKVLRGKAYMLFRNWPGNLANSIYVEIQSQLFQNKNSTQILKIRLPCVLRKQWRDLIFELIKTQIALPFLQNTNTLCRINLDFQTLKLQSVIQFSTHRLFGWYIARTGHAPPRWLCARMAFPDQFQTTCAQISAYFHAWILR